MLKSQLDQFTNSSVALKPTKILSHPIPRDVSSMSCDIDALDSQILEESGVKANKIMQSVFNRQNQDTLTAGTQLVSRDIKVLQMRSRLALSPDISPRN